jgi:hypothetical protein
VAHAVRRVLQVLLALRVKNQSVVVHVVKKDQLVQLVQLEPRVRSQRKEAHVVKKDPLVLQDQRARDQKEEARGVLLDQQDVAVRAIKV